ncbi:MAG: COX15/CtaA family protein, partial [Solirubrobacterales bacterium]
MSAARWMRRLAIAGVLLCFLVVVLGADGPLTAAGLGCPDWPGSYGVLTPAGAAGSAHAQAAYAGRPLQVGKAWREMIHRYAVGTLSLLILVLAVLALRARRTPLVSVPLVLALLATLIVQALLGMLTVTWRLNPLIVTLHLLFGLTTLALLWWLMLGLSQPATSWGASALRGPGHSISGGGAVSYVSAYRLTLLG